MCLGKSGSRFQVRLHKTELAHGKSLNYEKKRQAEERSREHATGALGTVSSRISRSVHRRFIQRLAGSYAASPLNHLGESIWVVDLCLAPGRHEYRFIADGEWIDDPNAKEIVSNPHGGFNSILIVEPV